MQNNFTIVVNLLSTKHTSDFNVQFDLRYNYEPQPHFLAFNLSYIAYFTLIMKNDGRKVYFEVTLKKGKERKFLSLRNSREDTKLLLLQTVGCIVIFTIIPFLWNHPLRVTSKKYTLVFFYIKYLKSYNCGLIAGKIIRKYSDYNWPVFRGIYDTSKCLPSIINKL